ncbi:MAG: hypothetical protein IMX05_01475 [Hydrogenibacillus schlegelii]|nr:hypothetical protein [Hydrogenibacillus schlegelii]
MALRLVRKHVDVDVDGVKLRIVEPSIRALRDAGLSGAGDVDQIDAVARLLVSITYLDNGERAFESADEVLDLPARVLTSLNEAVERLLSGDNPKPTT